MKNENEIIVGLDIGTTKIACFIGKRGTGDKVHILGFSKTTSVGVIHGSVINILDTANSIKKVVRMASDQAGVDVTEVYVGIAGQHIKSVQKQGSITIPEDHHKITEEDLERLKNEQRRLMLGPGEEVIHIFPQNYFVDGESLDGVNPIGVVGKSLQANFHIVTGNVNSIGNIYESVDQAGYKVKGMVLEPVASAYAVLGDDERCAGVAMVDIGGGTTDVAIFHDGIIRHTSVLPIAGNSITEDIRRGCSITKTQAESLKVKFGNCLPSAVNEDDVISIPGIHGMPSREIGMKTLASIINARTQVILEQVAFEIQESKFEKNLIAGVVLTGGGSKLAGIKNFAELITATDSRIGTPDEHIDKETDKNILEEIKHPMYATGIGLVLYGLEEYELNNQQEPIEEEKKEEPKAPTAKDVFDDLRNISRPVENATQPEPQHTVYTPSEQPSEPSKKETKSRKWGMGQAMRQFLDKFTNDGVDE